MNIRPKSFLTYAVILIAALPALTACEGIFYVLHAAEGQLGIQGDTTPIDDVLASGLLTEDEEDKLRLLVKARQYAIDTIGLNAGESYTEFYDSGGDPVVFSISASPRDSLEPYTWWFPFFGSQENLMFFDEDYLNRIEQTLIDQGYDTYTYEVDAYSTGGFFKDPVRSPMLKRHTLSIVDTIFHELLHNTIWRSGWPTFNESLATFVGRTAAAEYLVYEFGEDSGWKEVAEAYYADVDAVDEFLMDLYEDLAEYYAGPETSEEKIAGREAVYQAARDHFTNDILPTMNYPDVFAGYGDIETNNAWLRSNYRYHLNLDVFEAVYDSVGHDWPAALEVYTAAARDAGDPFEYLENWLMLDGEED